MPAIRFYDRRENEENKRRETDVGAVFFVLFSPLLLCRLCRVTQCIRCFHTADSVILDAEGVHYSKLV